MSETANPYADGMLPTVWTYTHPGTGQTVENVEALCRKVLNRLAAGVSPPLQAADYDESLGFLLGEVVVLAETRWKPDRYPRLGAWLDIALPTALIDWWRAYNGRFGEKRVLPDLRDLDDIPPFDVADLGGSQPEPELVDFAALPERSRRVVKRLGQMLADGATYQEIGAHFGRSREWVAEEVEILKSDISRYWLERHEEEAA